MDKETILQIRNIIEDICKNRITKEYIEELYSLTGNDIIPLSFNDVSTNTASFSPKYMNITVNYKKVDDWLERTLDSYKELFKIKDRKLLKSYLLVVLLLHEIEHSNQKLIAENKMETNYEFKHQAYDDIFDAMAIKKYIVPRPISLYKDIRRFLIYKKNAYDLILERNAILESYNSVAKIADYSNDEDIKECMIGSRNAYMLQGYLDNSEGLLKYTYDTLKIGKKYNKLNIPDDISLIDRVREGLELSEDERDEIVLSLRDNIKFKN